MKTKYLLVASLMILFTVSCKNTKNETSSAEKTLTIETKGIEYDSLFIRFAEVAPLFEGVKVDSITWKFQIPDSVSKGTASFDMFRKPFDWDTKTTFKTSFIANIEGEDLFTHQLSFEEAHPSIRLQYKENHVINNFNIRVKTPAGKDTAVVGTIDQTIFTMQPVEGSEAYIQMLDPFYSVFVSRNDTTYEGYMDNYIQLAKQYPDSKYLISQLANNLSSYKDKKDVQKIYDCLSNKYKNTNWGQAIEKYLNAKFENSYLPDAITGKDVPVIIDSTRYTVIIFSASWCQPCHKQLPLQKEIHQNLKDKVDFVTISIDDNNTIDKWKEFVRKEKLPWRSLLAYKDINGIRGKYYVPHIPHIILVHPDGNFEPLNLWEDKDVKKLYGLASN